MGRHNLFSAGGKIRGMGASWPEWDWLSLSLGAPHRAEFPTKLPATLTEYSETSALPPIPEKYCCSFPAASSTSSTNLGSSRSPAGPFLPRLASTIWSWRERCSMIQPSCRWNASVKHYSFLCTRELSTQEKLLLSHHCTVWNNHLIFILKIFRRQIRLCESLLLRGST